MSEQKPSEAAKATAAAIARMATSAHDIGRNLHHPVEAEKLAEYLGRAIREAVEAEREACAKIAEFWGECECGEATVCRDIAEDIRSRDGRCGCTPTHECEGHRA